MLRDELHQRRGQRVVWLQAKRPQTRADAVELRRVHARFGDRGDKAGEFRRGRAFAVEELWMDEIEPVERMRLILDAPVHVCVAVLASIALDGRRFIDN